MPKCPSVNISRVIKAYDDLSLMSFWFR